MRTKSIILIIALCISILSGCAGNANPPAATTTRATTSLATTPPAITPGTTGATTTKGGTSTDAVTSASIVDNATAFQKAIGTNGTWIICLTKDISVSKDIALEGEYKNGKKDANGKDIIQRKVALYAQDANRNITARYTLTAPKFTITSPEASIQHGTFKGDLYVSVKNFQLVDTTVEGNVYFTTDEAKSTFKMDAASKVTGKQELKK